MDPLPPDPNQRHVIAVLGPTGSGKSTFVNLASGSDRMQVGELLGSCTQEITAAPPFDFGDQSVVIIDTPGFDDANRSDTDVLNMIAAFLSESYKQGILLTGIVYMHRISDFRMGGVATRNFRMFRKLCGTSSLKNVAIVTNMWGTVPQRTAESREQELSTSDDYFKPVLSEGALFLRHTNTHDSACAILQQLLNKSPVPLQIQEELIDKGKKIEETEAGAELRRDLTELEEKYRREIDELMLEMQETRDEKTRLECQVDIDMARERLERAKTAKENMSSDYEQATHKAEWTVSTLMAMGVATAAVAGIGVVAIAGTAALTSAAISSVIAATEAGTALATAAGAGPLTAAAVGAGTGAFTAAGAVATARSVATRLQSMASFAGLAAYSLNHPNREESSEKREEDDDDLQHRTMAS